jgi:transcriptional regulator with XRE-family HTH domain
LENDFNWIKLKQTIGANIKKLRQVAGLTQEELAGLLGCGRANLAGIESGKTMATLATLYRAADALRCSVLSILPVKIESTEETESNKPLKALRDEAFAYAEKQGFHKREMSFGERLMLVVSELSEALEADRNGKWAPKTTSGVTADDEPITIKLCGDVSLYSDAYENEIRGTVEEEIADAIIRICDIAGVYGIDLDWHVAAKMAYNKTRPYMHGKKYG